MVRSQDQGAHGAVGEARARVGALCVAQRPHRFDAARALGVDRRAGADQGFAFLAQGVLQAGAGGHQQQGGLQRVGAGIHVGDDGAERVW